MILAAGLGTRLKPFTDHHPKALFEVDGKPLLEHAINHLHGAGITEVIINVHHFAGQIREYLKKNNSFGLNVEISDEEHELLETGGGLKKAAWFFEDCACAVVRNVDILSDLNLQKMVTWHHTTNALATLAVRTRPTSRYLLFDQGMQLCGWENRKTGENRISRQGSPFTPFAFSGIQIINPSIFTCITEEGKFSLTDLYLRLAKDQLILGYEDDGMVWEDIGRVKSEK